MVKLGDRNYSLIEQGIKAAGTYDPDKIFCFFEEQLYVEESDEIYSFLKWVHDNEMDFGSDNYENVFRQFKRLG